MEKVWQIKPSHPELRRHLSQALDISEVCAQILINRGLHSVEAAENFLQCDLGSLYSPFLLQGMREAVRRIEQAISRGEKIMVWGDYDIDGITGCALLLTVLKQRGAEVTHYLPNRLEEGYGLNKKGAQLAQKKGVRLLITVDCGISAHPEVDYLKQRGIDTIITDHHLPKEDRLPGAYAIINPLQKGCSYPYKFLSGAGVAAKLASALVGSQKDILDRHLDIITLGTVGDIVPLTGENRTLVKQGLVSLRESKKVGLLALMELSGLSKGDITTGHIGYILGPRINASGRLGSPEDSLKLLLTEDEIEAHTLAQRLCQENRLRQRIESQTLQEAIEQVEREINFKEHNVIVLGAAHWHQGVIGIVAARLVERYFRPTIMLSLQGEFGCGSGRSIDKFHLLEALTRCQNLLEEYGGHSRACGLRLKKEKFREFFQMINQVAQQMLMPEDLIPTLSIDLTLPLSNLQADLITELATLAPFGADNPRPLLCSRGLTVKSPATKVCGHHIKFWVTDGKLTCEAIGYNKAEIFPPLSGGETVDLAYTPVINNWQGNFSIQLNVEDLKIRD